MVKEMMKLVAACVALEIPHAIQPDGFGGNMVVLLDENSNRIGDAICHAGSYGHEMGLLEIMGKGCGDGDVIGYLNATEVIHAWTGPDENTEE